jgi:hypothetical protein
LVGGEGRTGQWVPTPQATPTLDPDGNRALDKVKARLCVDGRGQDRTEYRQEEIESPTANIASIFTIAQIAAAEGRFVMVGDVGSAYLNAIMPRGSLDKLYAC